MTKRRGGLALLAAVALLTGCGAYTRKDFAAQANAVCAATLRDLRGLPAPAVLGAGPDALHSLAAYLQRAAPLTAGESRQLERLRRPPGTPRQRALLAGYLRALAQSVVGLRALMAAARAGNGDAVARDEFALQRNPATARAGADGLTQCGAPGATVR